MCVTYAATRLGAGPSEPVGELFLNKFKTIFMVNNVFVKLRQIEEAAP